MNFEKFPGVLPEEAPLDRKKPENRESRLERYLAKARRIARIGFYAGFVALAGYTAKESIENTLAYKHYYEETSPADRARYRALREKLIEEVGEAAVHKIERGDRVGFLDRKEGQPKKPKIRGFEALGLTKDHLSHLWSEEDGAYPKKWVNGEVGMIEYRDEEQHTSDYGVNFSKRKASASAQGGGVRGGIITIWKVHPAIRTSMSPTELAEHFDSEFGHEIAHLNDWETDRDLSLRERGELLARVLERMQSEKPFVSIMDQLPGAKPYYQSIDLKDDQSERYLQAKEYWAQLCENYFAVPEWVQERYPEDYALVHEYVKRSDPSFDPARAEAQRDAIITQMGNT